MARKTQPPTEDEKRKFREKGEHYLRRAKEEAWHLLSVHSKEPEDWRLLQCVMGVLDQGSDWYLSLATQNLAAIFSIDFIAKKAHMGAEEAIRRLGWMDSVDIIDFRHDSSDPDRGRVGVQPIRKAIAANEGAKGRRSPGAEYWWDDF